MNSDGTDEEGGISVFSDPGSSLSFFLLDKDPFNNHTQVVNTLSLLDIYRCVVHYCAVVPPMQAIGFFECNIT